MTDYTENKNTETEENVNVNVVEANESKTLYCVDNEGFVSHYAGFRHNNMFMGQ